MYESDNDSRSSEENFEDDSEILLESRTKLEKNLTKYKVKLTTSKEAFAKNVSSILQQGKNYSKLLTLLDYSCDSSFKEKCSSQVNLLKVSFEKALEDFQRIEHEVATLSLVIDMVSQMNSTIDADCNIQDMLASAREMATKDLSISDKFRNEWLSEVMEKMNGKSVAEQIQEQFDNEGLALMEESEERLCPVMQIPIKGEAVKNPDCGHIFSLEGFNHLFTGHARNKKCPVAGCPHKVNRNHVVKIQV